MRKEDIYYGSRDGHTRIHAVKWIPDGEIKSILLLIHGMAEHIGRYDEAAAYFAERGILVAGNDLSGHGDSIPEDGMPGYFCEQDPATVLVRDVHRLKKLLQEEYPNVPILILGHSMGSFILRNYMFKYGTGIQGAIIVGTGTKKKIMIKCSIMLAGLQKLFLGDRHVAYLLDKLAFGDKSKIEASHRNDWLCTDHSVVEKYDADPLCGFVFTVNGFRTMLALIDRLNNDSNTAQIPKELPVLMVSGAEDAVGDCGAGVRRAYEKYVAAGMKNIKLKLYENMRHEILNETEKAVVYADIYEFINTVTEQYK